MVIRAGGRSVFSEDFPRFARILEKHTELEDRLFFPALEERAPGSTGLTELPHRQIEELTSRLTVQARNPEPDLPLADLEQQLDQLAQALETHLAEEEAQVMPAMMEHFEAQELWAMDARIMEFCSPEFMAEMLPWWFLHMNQEDRVAVAANMVAGVPGEILTVLAGCIAAGLPVADWLELTEQVPQLVA